MGKLTETMKNSPEGEKDSKGIPESRTGCFKEEWAALSSSYVTKYLGLSYKSDSHQPMSALALVRRADFDVSVLSLISSLLPVPRCQVSAREGATAPPTPTCTRAESSTSSSGCKVLNPCPRKGTKNPFRLASIFSSQYYFYKWLSALIFIDLFIFTHSLSYGSNSVVTWKTNNKFLCNEEDPLGMLS